LLGGQPRPQGDQSITDISKNYRRSNTQIIICACRRRVMVAGQCRPANPNDVTMARVEQVTARPGKADSYCAIAAAAATPSTTASTSSPDSGTSRPTTQ